MEIRFRLDRVTQAFADALEAFATGALDYRRSSAVMTALENYLLEDLIDLSTLDDYEEYQYIKQSKPAQATPQVLRGIAAIADLLDNLDADDFAGDGELAQFLRAQMEADPDMDAAKAFLKSVYVKNGRKMIYPTVQQITARTHEDAFIDSLASGVRAGNGDYEAASSALDF